MHFCITVIRVSLVERGRVLRRRNDDVRRRLEGGPAAVVTQFIGATQRRVRGSLNVVVLTIVSIHVVIAAGVAAAGAGARVCWEGPVAGRCCLSVDAGWASPSVDHDVDVLLSVVMVVVKCVAENVTDTKRLPLGGASLSLMLVTCSQQHRTRSLRVDFYDFRLIKMHATLALLQRQLWSVLCDAKSPPTEQQLAERRLSVIRRSWPPVAAAASRTAPAGQSRSLTGARPPAVDLFTYTRDIALSQTNIISMLTGDPRSVVRLSSFAV